MQLICPKTPQFIAEACSKEGVKGALFTLWNLNNEKKVFIGKLSALHNIFSMNIFVRKNIFSLIFGAQKFLLNTPPPPSRKAFTRHCILLSVSIVIHMPSVYTIRCRTVCKRGGIDTTARYIRQAVVSLRRVRADGGTRGLYESNTEEG